MNLSQPFFHFGFPLRLVRKGFVVSPTMSANRIEVHGSRNPMLAHRQVIVDAIENLYYGIITTMHNESRRSVFIDLQFVGIELHQFFAWLLSQEIVLGTLMRISCHSYNRIEKNLEVRTGFFGKVSSGRRSQMTTGR